MTLITKLITGSALALTLGSALPALAAGMDPATMTCADFLKLDATAQSDAMHAMAEVGDKSAGMADKMAGDKMAEGKTAAASATEAKMPDAAGMVTACTGHDDMMAMDAMHGKM